MRFKESSISQTSNQKVHREMDSVTWTLYIRMVFIVIYVPSDLMSNVAGNGTAVRQHADVYGQGPRSKNKNSLKMMLNPCRPR